jgi:hypothetical protein
LLYIAVMRYSNSVANRPAELAACL